MTYYPVVPICPINYGFIRLKVEVVAAFAGVLVALCDCKMPLVGTVMTAGAVLDPCINGKPVDAVVALLVVLDSVQRGVPFNIPPMTGKEQASCVIPLPSCSSSPIAVVGITIPRSDKLTRTLTPD